MYQNTTSLRRPPVRRVAFTLIELMIVLIVIGILMTITAAAVLRYLSTSQGYNSQSLIRRLAARLDSQMRLVSQQAMQEPIGLVGPNASSIRSIVMSMANNNPDRARVIWVKLRLKQAFPNSFTEALNPDNGYFNSVTSGVSLPPLPTYKKYLNNAGVSYSMTTLTGGIGQPYESSVCLLLALQQGQGGGGISAEEIGQPFIKDWPANGTTVKLVVDGYGSPVAFCRWPWQCYVTNPSGSPPGSGPQTGANNDPTDPRGLLCDYSWLTSSSPNYTTQFNSLLGYTPPQWTAAPAMSGQPRSFVLTPLIVSGGPDLTIGIDPNNGGLAGSLNNQTPPTVAAYDDIFSTQLQ